MIKIWGYTIILPWRYMIKFGGHSAPLKEHTENPVYVSIYSIQTVYAHTVCYDQGFNANWCHVLSASLTR